MDTSLNQFHYDIESVSQELHVRPQVLEKILKSFSNTLNQKILKLDGLVARNDIAQIRAILHEVEGTAGNLRLKSVYESAGRMHKAVKAKEPFEKVSALFKIFKNESFLFIDRFKG